MFDYYFSYYWLKYDIMSAVINMNLFLPVSKNEMYQRGWDQPDFILVSGDAYVDHPSFGHAIIARILEKFGYKVAIMPQPNINSNDAFKSLGEPRLGFLVTGGNIDSMVNHYTVSKRKRTTDNYTPQGKMGARPDRATIRYSSKLRELYPHATIIVGGIEASLRRLSHYDYWDNKVRRSLLLDSKADLLVYGMAEKTIVEIADALNAGLAIQDIIYIRNTVWKTKNLDIAPSNAIKLPHYDQVIKNTLDYVKSFQIQYKHTDAFLGKPLIESYQNVHVIQNPPEFPLNQEEMDQVYDLPFMRDYHPMYQQLGHIPAIDEVKFSLIANRGCFGGCNFCALTFHQGKIIQSRSKASIINEAKIIIANNDFKGYIHDVGGPTANFYQPSCEKQANKGSCTHKECIGYEPCDRLEVSHEAYLNILRELRQLKGIKKVFVRSGLRYDYLMYDKDKTFFHELVEHHISGQLKVAPEHVDDTVLKHMGKPSRELYDNFVETYSKINQAHNKNQYLVPYLMSSHPGSTLESAIELALYLKNSNQRPEQVQDFYPTPGTASTCMYYTGIDPFTNLSVYVPKDYKEKAMQRALIQYYLPQNYDLVKSALIKANRTDLIGNSPKCLIKAYPTSAKKPPYSGVSSR